MIILSFYHYNHSVANLHTWNRDDHDHEECEHFEKIEEGDSDEDEEIDQSQDY